MTFRRFLPHLVLLLCCLLVTVPAPAQKMPPPSGPREGRQVGDIAYDFTLKDMDGKEHRLSDLRGKRVSVGVRTGLSDGMRTAITGGGLKEDDEVVTGLMPVSSAMSGPTNPFMPGRPPGGGGRPRL